jgi:type III secretion protein J
MRHSPLSHDANRPPRSAMAAHAKRVCRFAARIVAMCAIGILAACTQTVTLQAGLSDRDANEIVSLLSRNGIDAKKHATKEGVTLIVKENEISRATELMQAAGLPKRSLSNLGQIFKKEGIISTPLEERVRYIYGLSAELENTLQQFDNVVTARVHVVLPERIAPGEPIQPSSAAVYVKYHPPFDEETAVPRIRKLVANSIPGLSGDDARGKVSVVLTPTETAMTAVEWTKVGPFSVQSSSAGMLVATLTGLGVLTLLSAGCAVFMLVFRQPKALGWIRQRVGKTPGSNAPDGIKMAAGEARPENVVA